MRGSAVAAGEGTHSWRPEAEEHSFGSVEQYCDSRFRNIENPKEHDNTIDWCRPDLHSAVLAARTAQVQGEEQGNRYLEFGMPGSEAVHGQVSVPQHSTAETNTVYSGTKRDDS